MGGFRGSPYSPGQLESKSNNLGVFVYPACPVAPADGTGVGPEDRTGAPLRKTFFVPDRHLAELLMMAFSLNGRIKSSVGHLIYSQSFLVVYHGLGGVSPNDATVKP